MFGMTKSTWAKVFGWLGGVLTVLGTSGVLGKSASPIATVAGPALTTLGIHQASNTSAGHPNGAN